MTASTGHRTVIHQLIAEGRKLKIKKKQTEDATKPPALRVGNSGCLVDTGKADVVYGDCPRKAHIRYLGIDIVADAMTHEIFDEGITNEDIVNELFVNGLEALGSKLTLKREEETPVAWSLPSGRLVTGRPDFVFFDGDKPMYMVELKKKLGYYGVRNSTYECKPDTKHLCQAAHYSWQLGLIPTFLVYRSGGIYHLDSDMRRDQIKASGITRAVEYQGARPAKVMPHYTIYELTWKDNVLYYQSDDMKEALPTVITPEGIQAFYEATDSIIEAKSLGPRPTSKNVVPGLKAGYSPCSYCELKEICDSHEDDYDTWIDHVKIKTSELAAWLNNNPPKKKGKK